MKMVFKIVRTDTVDPCKIQLPIGTHKFGRGIFLDCEDKRVSRNHGQLEVSDDSVTLKALHQNPCFFIRKGTEQSEVLRKDNSTGLSNGDKFGLLPDSYWYELLHCTGSPDITSATKEVHSDETNKAVNSSNDENNVTNLVNAEMDESAIIDFQLNETVDTEQRPESPSLLTSNQETEDQNADSATQAYQIPTSQANTPSKRLRDPNTSGSDEESKKIKTEPVDDTTPSTSDVANVGPSSSGQSVKVEPPSSPVKPSNNQLPTRERCMYGAQCYRGTQQSHHHSNMASRGLIRIDGKTALQFKKDANATPSSSTDSWALPLVRRFTATCNERVGCESITKPSSVNDPEESASELAQRADLAMNAQTSARTAQQSSGTLIKTSQRVKDVSKRAPSNSTETNASRGHPDGALPSLDGTERAELDPLATNRQCSYSNITQAHLKVAVITKPQRDLTPRIAEQLAQDIQEKVFDAAALAGNSPVPVFAPTFGRRPLLTDGVLKMWCANAKTLTWLKANVVAMPSPIPNTRLDVIPQMLVQPKIKAGLLFPEYDGDIARLRCILKGQNSCYDIDSWSIYGIKEYRTLRHHRMFLTLGIPKSQLPKVMARQRRVNYGMGTIYLRFYTAEGLSCNPPVETEATFSPLSDMTSGISAHDSGAQHPEIESSSSTSRSACKRLKRSNRN